VSKATLSVTLLLSSCDAYADLWNGWDECFKRYWPDCSLEKWLLCNEAVSKVPVGMRPLPLGQEGVWSANLIQALRILDTDYVLLWLDDLYLIGQVDNDRVMTLINRAINENWDYIRLNPTPGPPVKSGEIGRLPEGDIYRASTVLAVWKRTTLRDLLDPAENPWQFECHGSIRSDRYPNFYASCLQLAPSLNCVIKGRWDPRAISTLLAAGIKPNLDQRAVLDARQLRLRILNEYRSRALKLFPRKWQRPIRMAFLR